MEGRFVMANIYSGTLGLMSKALGKVNEVSNASKMTKNVKFFTN